MMWRATFIRAYRSSTMSTLISSRLPRERASSTSPRHAASVPLRPLPPTAAAVT